MPATRALSAILIAVLLSGCANTAHERDRFAVACKAYDFTPKQCGLLWNMKIESKIGSDDAATALSISTLAIGLSAGSR